MPDYGKSEGRSSAGDDNASSASGDNASTVQVNLRVDEAQKEHWEEYLDETHEYSSLSQLIRSAVEAEIQETDQPSNAVAPGITSDIEELKDDLERVRKDVSWLREQSQDDVDISDLAQRVFDELEALPRPSSIDIPDDVEEEDTYLQQRAALQVLTPDDGAEAEKNDIESYTVGALSDRLGANESRIQDAIEHLEDQFLPVVAVVVDGETHYFKED